MGDGEERSDWDPGAFDIFISFRIQDDDPRNPWVGNLYRFLQAEGYRPYYFSKTQDSLQGFNAEAMQVIAHPNCKAFILCCGDDMGKGDSWQRRRGAFEGQQPGPLTFNFTQKEILRVIERNGGVEMFERCLGEEADVQPDLAVIPVMVPNSKGGFIDVVGLPILLKEIPGLESFRENQERGQEDLLKRLKRIRSLKPVKAAPEVPAHETRDERPADAAAIEVEQRGSALSDWERSLAASIVNPAAGEGGQAGEFLSFVRSAIHGAYISLQAQEVKGSAAKGRSEKRDQSDAAATPTLRLFDVLALTEPQHKLLLGGPGSGKSTFLRLCARAAALQCLGQALSDVEQAFADALRRDVGGEQVWPVPFWVDAQELAGEMAKSPRSVEAFEIALKARLPERARDLFMNRISARPYLLLIDGLDQVAASERDGFIAAVMNFAARCTGSQLAIVTTARATSADDAARVSGALGAIVSGETGWRTSLISPLTPIQIKEFCSDLPGALEDRAVAERFQSALEDIAARSEVRAYVETPFMLMVAAYLATHGRKSAGLTGPALLYSVPNIVFSGAVVREEPLLRQVVGRVAAQMTARESLDVSLSEFLRDSLESIPAGERDAWVSERGARAFNLLTRGAVGLFREDDVAAGPFAAADEEPRGRFLHGLFRDVMAADFLVVACKQADWAATFESLGIWEDLAQEGKRWREAMRILLTALVLAPRDNGVGRAIVSELRARIAKEPGLSAKSALLRFGLAIPREHFIQLVDDADKAVAELEGAYAALRPELSPVDREQMFARIVQLVSRKYPPNVDLFTVFDVGAPGEERFVRVANAPVRVSQYQRFLRDVSALGSRAERFFAHVPGVLYEEEFFGVHEVGVVAKGPLDFLITNHSEEFWAEQALRYPGRPVVGVNWIEAAAYCAWLAEKIEADDTEFNLGVELGGGDTVRMLTPHEWSTVVRVIAGGGEQVWGSGEPGEDKAALINWAESGLGSASTIGLFPVQGGLYDFAGNVREWSSEHEMTGSGHKAYVLGGSFLSPWQSMRADRGGERRESTLRASPAIGFRWIVGAVTGS